MPWNFWHTVIIIRNQFAGDNTENFTAHHREIFIAFESCQKNSPEQLSIHFLKSFNVCGSEPHLLEKICGCFDKALVTSLFWWCKSRKWFLGLSFFFCNCFHELKTWISKFSSASPNIVLTCSNFCSYHQLLSQVSKQYSPR